MSSSEGTPGTPGPLPTQPVQETTAAPRSGWEGPPSMRVGPTVGSIVSRAFKAYGANFWTLALLVTVMVVPFFVLVFAGAFGAVSLTPQGARGEPPDVGTFFAVFVPVLLLASVVFAVGFGGMVYGTVRWLGGQRAGVGDMLRQGLRTLLPVVGTAFLVTLAVLLGYVLLIIPGIMVAVATSLAFPAVVVERLGPVAAFQRSLDLSRGFRWQLFGCFAVLFVVQMGLSIVNMGLQLAVPIAGAFLSIGVMLLSYPLPWLVIAVAYHDLRVAKEGVDTSALVQVFE